MFWQGGHKAVTGTCGFLASRFPVFRVDVPKCAPTMLRDGAGQETSLLVWPPEMCQGLQAWPGFSSAPVWPPQLLRAGRSENHCRTTTTKGLSSAAPITASLGLMAHLEAQQSVLPKSYMTCQDNGLFASLSISLCEDDKFIESDSEAFVRSGGVSAWLEGNFARTNSEWKRRQGFRFFCECFNWHIKLKHIWKGTLTETKFLW